MSRIFVRFKITVSNEIGDLLNPNKVNNIILNFILEVKKDTSPMNIAVGGGGITQQKGSAPLANAYYIISIFQNKVGVGINPPTRPPPPPPPINSGANALYP